MFKALYEKYKHLFEQYQLERYIWNRAGKPVRDANRMLEIYNICESCENIENNSILNRRSCGICKCSLHPSDTTLPNKIAWATTRCPLEEPKWVEEEGFEKLTEENGEIETYIKNDIKMLEKTDPLQPKKEIKINDCGCGKRR